MMASTRRANEVGGWLVQVMDLPRDRQAEYIARHCGDPQVRAAAIAELSDMTGLAATVGIHKHNLAQLFGSADAEMAGLDADSLTADPPAPGVVLRDPNTGRLRWEILGERHGGMSLLYFGVDMEEDQPFVAKTYPRAVFNEIPQLAREFSQESKVWLGIPPYPHIAVVHGVEVIGGRPYLFMNYYPQGDLSAHLGLPEQKDRLPGIISSALHICDGLNHAYRHGVIAHRDIKPANCLIHWRGAIALADFGIAKPAGNGLDLHAGYGTPEYLAPEHWEPGAPADQRADVYALGATLYEMITARTVFGSRPETTKDELKRCHATAPVPIVSDQPHWLNDVLQQCLHKDKSARFQTIQSVREALARGQSQLTGWQDLGPLPG
ncbi:MAG: serine/threonine protein kinase [Phycisphaeraceae bacterium]|nr:serine/threonine protein kinase [Phycisphaeraceae bacterium]